MAKKKKSKEELDETLAPSTDEARAESPQPDLEAQLAEAREEAAKNWDLYLRSQAELDNYRKRVQRDRQDQLRFGNENLLRELLPVIDNLDRAVQHAKEASASSDGLLEGVEMTLNQLQQALGKFGVTPIVAQAEPFDPARHEAVGQLETAEQPPNTVAQELQKGYLLHERLLRPAMVMVAKAPEIRQPAADAEDNQPS